MENDLQMALDTAGESWEGHKECADQLIQLHLKVGQRSLLVSFVASKQSLHTCVPSLKAELCELLLVVTCVCLLQPRLTPFNWQIFFNILRMNVHLI